MFQKKKGHKLESTEIEMLGKCEKIVIDKDNTTIINGGGIKKNIYTRINQIKSQIQTTSSDYDK